MDTTNPASESTLSSPRRGRLALLIGMAGMSVLVVVLSAMHGWEFRKQAWDFFSPGRFRGDITRNYVIGTMALREGLLNLYEDQAAHPPRDDRRINYSPLRTAVFMWWASGNGEPEASASRREPVWKGEWEFNRRLNELNSVLALLGAVGAGLLVWTWSRPRRRSLAPVLAGEARVEGGLPEIADAPHPGPLPRVRGRGRMVVEAWRDAWPFVAGVIGYLVFWYNPAGLVLAHGWPSPNAWVMPFFMWAVLFCSWEWWFLSGVVIGLGAMFQGQHLLVAPLFVLWPLFALQPMRAVRWVVGFGISFMGVVSGWLLTMRVDPSTSERVVNGAGVGWIVFGVMALIGVVVIRLGMARWKKTAKPQARDEGESVEVAPLRRGWRPFIFRAVWVGIPILVAIGLIAPLMGKVESGWKMAGALGASLGLVGWVWLGGWRSARWAVPALVAMQLLLMMPIYGASDAWLEVGFKYGTERHPQMAVGPANNLGALLSENYGFRNIHEVMWTIEPDRVWGWPGEPIEVEMRALLLGVYGVGLVLAALATAIQWRRGDRNFLLAVSVGWFLMAMLPAQMHERYLGFAALGAALWIGARGGVGWTLLGAFVSAVAYSQIARSMAGANRQTFWRVDQFCFNNEFFGQVERATPDVSWALLLGMLIVLFAAFTKGKVMGDE